MCYLEGGFAFAAAAQLTATQEMCLHAMIYHATATPHHNPPQSLKVCFIIRGSTEQITGADLTVQKKKSPDLIKLKNSQTCHASLSTHNAQHRNGSARSRGSTPSTPASP
jgi:hypothetical protein